jgi:hypothetical protein
LLTAAGLRSSSWSSDGDPILGKKGSNEFESPDVAAAMSASAAKRSSGAGKDAGKMDRFVQALVPEVCGTRSFRFFRGSEPLRLRSSTVMNLLSMVAISDCTSWKVFVEMLL